ncbi:hypothetical protein [Neokomagataea tanensis]|nr:MULTISPECIES: hypothetical protein [Neokomagataea]
MMVVHRLPGGQRVIDVLGNDPSRLELRGRFVGAGAQQRAQTIERMRDAGAEIQFSAAGLALKVFIFDFSYTFEDKGALCSYSLTLEASNTELSNQQKSSGQLFSGEVGSALQGIQTGIGGVLNDAFTELSQLGTTAAQIMPLASILGAGGTLSKASDALMKVTAVTQTSSTWLQAPSSVQVVSQELESAKGNLISVVESNSTELDNFLISDDATLGLAGVRSGIETISIDSISNIKNSQNYISNL